jgi:hypothetical protein
MSVRVIARIRPLLPAELDKDTIVKVDSTDGDSPGAVSNIVRLPNPKNEAEEFSFQFNRVFGSEATQEDVFSTEGIYTFS